MATNIDFSQSTLAKVGFWASTALAGLFAVVPLPLPTDLQPPDKLMHVVAFGTLTAFAIFAFRRVSPYVLSALLSAYGALIELIQMIPIVNRDADFHDWMVDNAGILIALAFIYVAMTGLVQNRLHRGVVGLPCAAAVKATPISAKKR